VSKVEPRVRSVKKLPHWLLSCTRPPRTLGHASSAVGSTRASAHRRRAKVGDGRCSGGWSSYPMVIKLGQKEREAMRIGPAKGIGKWPSQSSANWQRVGGGSHLSVGEETVRGVDIFGHFFH
jgi:hypothetical protein